MSESEPKEEAAAGRLRVAPRPPVKFFWFTLVGCVYLATRLVGLFVFAPHNDEVIYAEEAQAVAGNWAANRYLTLDGRQFGDYRQPLLSWLTSLGVGRVGDPLLGVRLVTALAAFSGFVFAQVFVARVWGRRAALGVGWLITLSGSYEYFDSISLNEPLLYGLSAAYLWCLYGCVSGQRWLALPAAVLLAGMLTTKDTARVWLPVSAVVLLLAATARHGAPWRLFRDRREGLLNLARLAAVVIGGFVGHVALVPRAFAPVKAQSPQAQMVLTPAQAAAFPTELWGRNARFAVSEFLAVELGYLTPLAVLVVLGGLWQAAAAGDRRGFWTVILLGAMYVLLSAPIVLLARINFVRHYAVGLYLLYATVAVAADLLVRHRPEARWPRGALIAALLAVVAIRINDTYLPLSRWGQSDIAMRESAIGWSNGLGVREMVMTLKSLPPGLLLYDPSWGHPGTDVTLRRHQFPQLQLAPLVGPTLIRALASLTEGTSPGNVLYLLIDTSRPDYPPVVRLLAKRGDLVTEERVFPKQYRGEVRQDSAIVLFTVRARTAGP